MPLRLLIAGYNSTGRLILTIGLISPDRRGSRILATEGPVDTGATLDVGTFFAALGVMSTGIVLLFGWVLTDIRDLRKRVDRIIDRGAESETVTLDRAALRVLIREVLQEEGVATSRSTGDSA